MSGDLLKITEMAVLVSSNDLDAAEESAIRVDKERIFGRSILRKFKNKISQNIYMKIFSWENLRSYDVMENGQSGCCNPIKRFGSEIVADL